MACSNGGLGPVRARSRSRRRPDAAGAHQARFVGAQGTHAADGNEVGGCAAAAQADLPDLWSAEGTCSAAMPQMSQQGSRTVSTLPPWLTTAQLAEHCGVDRSKVYYHLLLKLE